MSPRRLQTGPNEVPVLESLRLLHWQAAPTQVHQGLDAAQFSKCMSGLLEF